MNSKKRIKIKIAGEEFYIFTQEDQEHVNEVTNFVNKRIDELMEKNPHLSKTLSLAMVSMNIADDLIRVSNKKYEDVKNKITDKMADMLEKRISTLEEDLNNTNEYLKISEQRVITLQRLLTEKDEEINGAKAQLNEQIKKINELTIK
jgi:cell division protein ZapA